MPNPSQAFSPFPGFRQTSVLAAASVATGQTHQRVPTSIEEHRGTGTAVIELPVSPLLTESSTKILQRLGTDKYSTCMIEQLFDKSYSEYLKGFCSSVIVKGRLKYSRLETYFRSF